MNYTKAHLLDHEDEPEDWLGSSLVLSRALGLLLQENEGVIVDLKNDMKLLLPKMEKVIVYSKDGQIHIDEYEGDEDILEGQMIWMHKEEADGRDN